MTQPANPPVGMTLWSNLGTTVWGTDIIVDTTVYRSGSSSIKFLSGAPNDVVRLFETPVTDGRVSIHPCAAGDVFSVAAWVRAGRKNVGDNISIGIGWYDSALAFLSGTDVFNAPVTTINTWERKRGFLQAPAGTYYMGAGYGRASSGFDYWLDDIDVQQIGDCCSILDTTYTTVQSVPSGGSGTLLTTLTTETYDFGSNYDNTACIYTFPHDGVYAISGSAYFSGALADGDIARLLLQWGIGVPTIIDEKQAAAAWNPTMVGSIALFVTAGTTVGLAAYHNHGTNLNVAPRFLVINRIA
jgi:hypothetical protein